MKNNGMCDYLGMVHEFQLCLKRAGLEDAMIKRIVNSKGNHLAKKMVTSYKKEAQKDVFELLLEFSFQGLCIKESEMLAIVGNAFYQHGYNFDHRLESFQGTKLLADKRFKVSFYRPREPVSHAFAKRFIDKNGSFPGFYGLASVWLSESLHKEKRIPKNYQIYGFNKENGLCPVLTKFGSGIWHFSVCRDDNKSKLGERTLIIVLNEE
jgi:hypothetical protein